MPERLRTLRHCIFTGRNTPSVCSLRSQPPSPRGRRTLSVTAYAVPAPPKGELLAWRESFRHSAKAPPRGSCRVATEGVLSKIPNKKLPRRVAGGAFIFLFQTRMRRPDMVRSRSYFRNFATARATMPPRMPDTRNSATPCTPTSSTTNMKGLAAPLTDTRFCT